jgi:polar amino acid transport system substrate-binding protein
MGAQLEILSPVSSGWLASAGLCVVTVRRFLPYRAPVSLLVQQSAITLHPRFRVFSIHALAHHLTNRLAHRAVQKPFGRAGRRGVAAAAAIALLAGGLPARAEGVLERIARSGELVLTGYPSLPPLLTLDAKGQAQGYAVVVAERIAAELSRAVGRPVTLRFAPVADNATPFSTIAAGKADLACGFPFSWAGDMHIDHSLAIGLSGLRLLAPSGRFDGSPAGLAGRSIGVVRASLAQGQLQGMQPKAKVVPFNDLGAAVTALQAGEVDGVIGDSIVLAGQVQSRGLQGLILTPELPYEVYGVSCLVPADASTYRHLVNLAIVRLLQGYLERDPQAVAAVDRWLGPGRGVGIPQARLDAIFEGVLIGVETIRLVPDASAEAGRPPTP